MNINNTIPISQARKDIFAIAEQVQKPGQYFTVTENGRPKVVVLSASEFESLVETVNVLNAMPDFEDDAQEAEAAYKIGKYVTLDQLLKKEGYVKVAKQNRKHGVYGRNTSKSSR